MHSKPLNLTFRQRRTWFAHLFKALCYQHHKPFAPMIRPLLSEDAVIIDVGGHAGQFTKLLSRLVPKGHVYTFEPGAYALSILTKVIRSHGLSNVTLIPCGLSDSTTVAHLNVPIKKSGSLGFGMSHIAQQAEENVRTDEIVLMTLDGFAEKQGLTRMDLIKIDIEGWELHALKGARESMRRYRPALMVEVVQAPLARAGAAPIDIFAQFEGLDYRIFRTDERQDYKLSPVKSHEGDGDYLFVPAEKAHMLDTTQPLAA